MTPFRSALINRVDLRTPDLHIRTFALHRHEVDESAAAQAERHRWCQAILYLWGWGQHIVAGERAAVEPGVLVMLPPGQMPAADPAVNRPPVSLVIDFRLKGALPSAPTVCAVSQGLLSQIREQLTYLLRAQARASDVAGWESSAVILQMLTMLLRAAGWLEKVPPVAQSNGDSAMHRLLLTMALESPLQQVVQRSGYQRDHLNRLVKKETGLTLGQFRTQRRLTKAKELLAQGIKVGDVAGAVGLPDQSYFARWFRRQTGQSPSRWIQASPEKSPTDFMLQCG